MKDNDKDVRVIVFVDESNTHEDILFKKNTQKQYLEGYADADSIYDTYKKR